MDVRTGRSCTSNKAAAPRQVRNRLFRPNSPRARNNSRASGFQSVNKGQTTDSLQDATGPDHGPAGMDRSVGVAATQLADLAQLVAETLAYGVAARPAGCR